MPLISNISKERYEEIDRQRQQGNYLSPQSIPDNTAVRLRIVAPGVAFWQGWLKESIKPDRSPIRWQDDEPQPDYPAEQWEDKFGGGAVKWYECYPVWNHTNHCLQILQVHQATVQNFIRMADEEYSDIRKFDFSIKKEGSGKNVKYQCSLSPESIDPKEFVPGLLNVPCEMTRLLSNEDPFEDGAKPLDLSFYGEQAPTEPAPAQKAGQAPAGEGWRLFKTRAGLCLGEATLEQLTEMKGKLQDAGLLEDPKYYEAVSNLNQALKWHLEQATKEDEVQVPFI